MSQGRGEEIPLDFIGIEEDTDKSSLVGGYLPYYESAFAALRDAEFTLLEIGVLNGGSVRTWSRFFTKAKIVGVDIDPATRRHETDRIQIEIGSQDDPEFLHSIVSRHSPLVIIDDGSHRSDHMMFTFERLFPALPPGGWYVIEDVHFHLLDHEKDRIRGDTDTNVADYIAGLTRDRLRAPADVAQNLTGMRRYLIGALESVTVIPQAAVFRKAHGRREDYLRHIKPAVDRSKTWLTMYHYAETARALGAPMADIEHALREAIARDPNALIPYERLADIHFSRGEGARAAEILEEAIQIARPQPAIEIHLRRRAESFRRG